MAIKQVDEFEGVIDRLHTTEADFRVGRLDAGFTDAEGAEETVEEYFKTLDYDVFTLRGLGQSERSWLSRWFRFFDGFDFSQPGVPDLFVCRVFAQVTPANWRNGRPLSEECRVQDYRFIEVKSSGDDLRQTQLKWIGSNPHLPIEVIIVSGGDEE